MRYWSSDVFSSDLDSLLSASGGFGGIATQIGRNVLFGAIVNAVRSDTDSNILSTPSVMTLDSQIASILVGQEVTVTTGEALSQNFDNQFRTVQRQDVGIQLEVKPQINAGGAIKLFLRQEVSSIAGPVSNDSSRSEEHTSELQSLMRISYAVFCLKKKKYSHNHIFDKTHRHL